jgi:hypothetical protein
MTELRGWTFCVVAYRDAHKHPLKAAFEDIMMYKPSVYRRIKYPVQIEILHSDTCARTAACMRHGARHRHEGTRALRPTGANSTCTSSKGFSTKDKAATLTYPLTVPAHARI